MRIDEIYTSVQGEGPRVGWPTIFVRTGGCNLRCPGWPCDTQHAINPVFRHEWEDLKPEEVFLRICEQPIVNLEDAKYNICFTGGEPFLQPAGELKVLTTMLKGVSAIMNVECFSNGSLGYPAWAFEDINFVMDWKLPGSGEYKAAHQHVRCLNFMEMGEQHSVKFTIKNREDYEVALMIWEDHVSNSLVQVFYGAVWGELDNAELISWVLADGLPWRFQMQIHNYVWDRNLRGI